MSVGTAAGDQRQLVTDADGTCQFPATDAQQRLWLAAAADPSGIAYNIAHAVVVHGRFDVEAFARALHEVVRRHDALRTRFARADGELAQIVSPECDVPLVVEKVEGTHDQALIDEIVERESSGRFDLGRGPLLRARVIEFDGERRLVCMTVHHIVCDGWSLSVLQRELARAYTDCIAGRAPLLGPAPLQYPDYAVWQHEVPDPRLDSSLEYWRRQLADLPPLLPLPIDRVRPERPTGDGDRVNRRLPEASAAAIERVAREERTTAFVVLLAAFAAFLHRWTGAADIPIGTPAAGRDRLELESVVGLFVNTIVARFRIEPDWTFRRMVAVTRELMLDGVANQWAPFERVVAACQPRRIPGVAPMFQVMFALQHIAESQPFAGVTRSEVCNATRTGAKSDLTLLARQRAGALDLLWEYNRELFDPGTIDAGLRAFVTLLGSAMADPDAPIGSLAWLTDQERTAALLAGQGDRREYPADTPVHRLFERCAADRPHSIAIESAGGRTTYADLNHQADCIAVALRRAGVMPGDRVGLLLERGDALVRSMLGVLKAGAAYVPVDPAYPEARVRFLLDDAAVRTAIVADGRSKVPDMRLDVIRLDEIEAPPSGGIAPVEVDAESPAYVLYTSGSTGAPKGVVVPHKAISRLVVNTDYIEVQPSDRVAQAANAAFDAITFEVWGALLNGATVVIIAADAVRSPRLLKRELRARDVSILFVTTAVFNRVATEEPGAFATLRVILFGGEASDPRAVQAIRTHAPAVTLVHVYGPTESTTFATAYPVTAVDPSARSIPIGRPIANTSAWVLDERLEPVPPGVAATLYLGGDGLALAYHNRAAETAERFVSNPHGPGRLYNTGDRCRAAADGTLEFLGRTDRQVKIRGFRIELSELEAVLTQCPGVARAGAEVTGAGDQMRLVAAVVPAAGAALDADAVRAFTAARLPWFMVPSIAVVGDLAVTANGKIDRMVIAEAAAAAARGPQYTAPRDPLEGELADLWSELLGVTPIGIHDDFFALGGHSLLAATLVDRVERLFGRRVSMSALLREPTIAGLATAYLETEGTTPPLVALRESGRRPPLFFMHGDIDGGGLYCRRLAAALDEDQPFYAIAPDSDPAAPLESIEAMAERDLQLIQRVHPTGPIAVGGYCHGALVAYEIARRLSHTGRVATLLMVDPSAVEPRLKPVGLLVRLVARLLRRSDAARVRIMFRIVDTLLFVRAADPRAWRARIQSKVARMLGLGGKMANASDEPEPPRHDGRVLSRYRQAVAAYVPGGYRGRVALFVTPRSPIGRTRGWHRAARQLTVIDIEGNHTSCVTTHVGGLAAALDAELRASGRGAAGSP